MDKTRETVGEYFIYFIISIWFSTEVLLNSTTEYILWWEPQAVNSFMGYFCLILLAFQIVFIQHYNAKEIFIIVMVSMPIMISTLNSHYSIMFSTWLFIMASKYIDFEKVVKLLYIILIVMICVVFYLYFAGWITEVTLYRGNTLRHSWGFVHPNWLGVRCFQLVLMHCYLRRHKLLILDYALVILTAWFVNRVPNCKTAYFALVFLFVALVVSKLMEYVQGGSVFFAKALILIAILANVISVALSFINIRGYHILSVIDRFMSRRFSLCYKTLKYYGLSLFGQDIELYVRRMNVLVRRFYIDTAYMAILLRYGIVVFVVFTFLYIITMIYLLRTNSYFMIMTMCLYAVYGMMENTFFSMTQNVFLMVLALPIYNIKIADESYWVNKEKVKIKISI